MVATLIIIGSVVVVTIVTFAVLIHKRGGNFSMAWKGPGVSGQIEYKENTPIKPSQDAD